MAVPEDAERLGPRVAGAPPKREHAVISLETHRRMREAALREAKKKSAALARSGRRGGSEPMVNWRHAPRFLVAAILILGGMWLVQRMLASIPFH